MAYTQVYRSGMARVLGALTVLICAGGLATLALRGDERDLLRYAGPLMLVAWMAWFAYWRPHVTLDEQGITLHNVFRTVHVTWASVVEIQSRYGLRVDTEHGSYDAWAVSAPVGRERMLGGDTEASSMMRRRLERLRGLGELAPDMPAEDPRVTWNSVAVGGVIGLVALTVAGFVLAR